MKKRLAVFLTFALIVGLSAAGITSRNSKSYAKEAQMHLEIPDSVKKENEFQVKVILNSDVDLYSVDAYLSYDSDLLEFIPDNDCVMGSAGVLELKDTYDAETKNATYEITFKALDTGEAEIALTDVFLIDYADLDYIEVAPSAKRFDIGINKKVEGDARLSDLLVAPGEMTEAFNPDQLDYEMHVGLDVEMVGISAIPMDEDSVIGLEMPEKLEIGENTIVITVTALSGHVNTYTIKVYREEIPQEADLESTEEQEDMGDTGELTEETTEAAEEVPSQTAESVTTETTVPQEDVTTEENPAQTTENGMSE